MAGPYTCIMKHRNDLKMIQMVILLHIKARIAELRNSFYHTYDIANKYCMRSQEKNSLARMLILQVCISFNLLIF